MKLNENARLFKKMIRLIEVRKTGSPTQLSSLLGISRSQLYVQIDELKSLGIEIEYDRKQNSFCFAGSKRVVVREPVVIVDDEELTTINGGNLKKSFRSFFWTEQRYLSI